MISDSTTIRVPEARSLGVGQATTFDLPDSDEQGFVIRTPLGLRAFRNRCRHWPCPLDMDDAEFWNDEAQMIQCKVHGALYRPEDGLCIFGPCSGAPLTSYEVREDGEDALVQVPRA
jgi:nitrite reductase/ring-hydroxylating ferredoxin subunit